MYHITILSELAKDNKLTITHEDGVWTLNVNDIEVEADTFYSLINRAYLTWAKNDDTRT